MFLTMYYKKQNIVLTMPLTMLIAHPYLHLLKGNIQRLKRWWSYYFDMMFKNINFDTYQGAAEKNQQNVILIVFF